jgi:trans-aconitate 2-methyltransferase
MEAPMWDPGKYLAFADHRSRPFFDLIGRISVDAPRRVVDLGCGPGNLTVALAQRWPSAVVEASDSSPEMVAAARERGIDATVLDVREWQPHQDTDVVVSNAVLQWVSGHDELLARWVKQLPHGAWLAFQVPGNFDAPSHRLLRQTARRYDVGHLTREAPVDDPAGYARLFLAAGASVDAWETTYLHLLPDAGPEHPVLRWIEGTALRPVKAALDDNAWQAFRADLGRELAAAYPAAAGHVAFPFRRVFAVARTAA